MAVTPEMRQARRVFWIAGAIGAVTTAALALQVWHAGGVPLRMVRPGFEKNAAAGDAEAQFRLAMVHYPGGEEPDPARAAHLLRAAAKQHHLEAQFALATLLDKGLGVERNVPESFDLLREAAGAGHVAAQAALGMMYQRGEACPVDDAVAVGWYKLAAAGGDVLAQYNLGMCYRLGRGTGEDPNEAAKWLRESSGNGLKRATLKLALCYRDGYGVPQNEAEALRLVALAESQSDDQPVSASKGAVSQQ